MKITYLGHSCFTVETSKTKLIVDPFLSGNPVATVAADSIECEYVVVTHGHGDHIGDTIAIAKKNNATVIGCYEVATYCGGQGCNVHPMHIGGAFEFPFGKVKLTHAIHGSGLESENGMIYMGNPAGVLLFVDGQTIYHAGDTALFSDMKLIGERHPIDIAMLPIGDNFTMGIDDAAYAAKLLNAKCTIPMHYNTFDLIKQDPNQFADGLKAEGLNCKIMAVNDSFES